MKKIGYIALAALTLMMSFNACDELDQYPSTETSGNEVYSSVDGYRQALAKIYAAYVIRGQEEGGGNADLNELRPVLLLAFVFQLAGVRHRRDNVYLGDLRPTQRNLVATRSYGTVKMD